MVWPGASVLALYVVGGLVGAGVSTNMVAGAVSAGAPAAVCSLVGAALPFSLRTLRPRPPSLLCSVQPGCRELTRARGPGAAWADQALNWRLYRNRPATVVVLLGATAQFVLLGLLPLLDNFAVAPAFLAGLAGGCLLMRRRRGRSRGRCCWGVWQVRWRSTPASLCCFRYAP